MATVNIWIQKKRCAYGKRRIDTKKKKQTEFDRLIQKERKEHKKREI